ncbi:YdcF family protein [Paracoccaceae bacterium]|nr:YdcF family protein [Paracoccaceae bacterium]
MDSIIVLGGGTGSGKVAEDRNDYTLGEGSERVLKGLEFIRKKPNGTIIFTGFSENLFHGGLSEAEIIEKLIKALNVNSRNILFEKRSRNTFENAIYTSEIVGGLQIKKWGLVTSASHMKRALATFNKQSSEISFDPIPVDFQTKNSIYWGPGKMQSSLNFWRTYIHETIGYWVYKMTGKL